MRLKTKIMLAAVPAAAIVLAGTVIALRVQRRRMNKRQETAFLPEEVRAVLTDLCTLKGEDFAPDGMGSSVYQRRLETLSDKQLIGVYIAIKTVEVLRARGTNIGSISKQELARELRSVASNKPSRHDVIKWLLSLGVDTVRSMLGDGLTLAGLAAANA